MKTTKLSAKVTLPTPARDRALGLTPKAPTSPLPAMVIILRPDRKGPESVSEAEIRWGLNVSTVKWALAGSSPLGKQDAAFVRESPNSPWGIQVEILGEGR